MSNNLEKSLEITNNDDNSNIMSFMLQFIELYINHKKSCNIAKNTQTNINSALERFLTFISDEQEINTRLALSNINKYFINNYLNFLDDAGLSKETQKLHLTIIKNFLVFVADSDIKNYGFLKLSLDNIKIKTQQREKESFTQNEQRLLLSHIIKLDATQSYLAQRNALLLKILYYTGVRVTELINIKWTDINEFDDVNAGLIYEILISGKSNKQRFTYITYDKIINNLEFLRAYSAILPTEYLLNSTHGNQCNRSSLLLLINNLLKKAGINKTGIHIFRHTFARNLVNKNVNLSTIKDLLGHTNITVTAQFYAKSNENAKKDALKLMI